jgi:lysophospholipase L1-like esterase
MMPNTVTRTIITAILIGILAIGSFASQRSANAQSEQIYLALGDSIPAGLLASIPADRGYPALLRDLIETERQSGDEPGNIELINLSEPGETIESFIDDGQLDAALSEIDDAPNDSLQTITLTIGGNNILSLWESTLAERNEALDEFETGFATVVEELEEATSGMDVDVVVTTYYDLTEGDPTIEGSNAWWLARFNDVIRETADTSDFIVVDLADTFADRITELTWFPADIHPNNAGHQLIARAIWQELAYDQDAPDVEITRPDTDEVRSRTPTIHVAVSDNVGIDEVILEIDDEPVAELIYVADRERWIGIWDARDYPDTEATITVRVTDVSGNTATDSVSVLLPSR